MFLELGRVSQELVQEPMRHSTLNRSVFRSNVGVEVLPERTSMTPPLLSVRHGCKTDLCTDTRIMGKYENEFSATASNRSLHLDKWCLSSR